MSGKAILVVSFGTTFQDTREKTIDVIVNDVKRIFPEYRVYEAWTSSFIINILKKRDGIVRMTVKEAMEQMAEDGITDVIVQPTHIISGIENDRMTEDAESFRSRFRSLKFGYPMLAEDSDYDRVIDILQSYYGNLAEDEALVLMGHGTEHFNNNAYSALNFRFADRGCENFFIGTVEAYPDVEAVLRCVERKHMKSVLITPFMIVAGDHANNDMAGDDGSWKEKFETAGYKTACLLKGLGEYPEIRELFIDHIRNAIQE